MLDKILRYEAALERQLYRAMNQLERLQRRRQGETIPAPLSMEISAKADVEITERTQMWNLISPVIPARRRVEDAVADKKRTQPGGARLAAASCPGWFAGWV